MPAKSLVFLYESHDDLVSDKWSSYISNYELIFKTRRRKIKNLLEIGVQNGGSLQIWLEYFPCIKKIIGCDVEKKCATLDFSDPRIDIVIGDVNSPETIQNISDKEKYFDVVIDDGSHKSPDIIKSFCTLAPMIKDGGLYIIEDLHCSYWSKYDGGLEFKGSAVEFFKMICDLINLEHWRKDHNLETFLHRHLGDQVLPLSLLERLHSVRFLNSMCIVEIESSERNLLGKRLISGNREPVKQVLHLAEPASS